MKKPSEIKVLIACEESQTVCKAFRARGFESYSCDLKPCSGGHPEWHHQGDVFEFLNTKQFDLVIAHPPCTHLAVSGARHFEAKIKSGVQQEAIDFFMRLANLDVKHLAIENPVCIMSSVWRSPDQIIQPWYFGDEFQKTTCLWLKNLPLLFHAKEKDLFAEPTHVSKGEFVTFKSGKRMSKWMATSFGDSEKRSKTFGGIAQAMAEQWGDYILNN